MTPQHLKIWHGGSNATVSAPCVIKLFEDIQRDPFHGIGKSEPLKYELAGCWSRRIDQEHRLVYQILDGKIRILACRYHH